MVLSTSKFQSLSVRPPTPPKDLHDPDIDPDKDAQVLDFLKDPFGMKEPVAKVIAPQTLLNTPQTSPSSESGIPSSVSRPSSKKKVNFEPQPCTTNGNAISSQSYIPLHSSPLRPLPRTRIEKPLKSILKPSDAAATPPPAEESAPAHKYKSFAEMLESIMKQLASQTRSARYDAYHSLQRTMQAYNEIPDTQALVDKMGLLTQFMQRDMLAIGIDGASLDSQLVTQALKFLMALVRIPDVRPVMPDDFCTFVVDRIIEVAGTANLTKMVVNTHLAVLMQQNFRPKTMTPARVERILDVLDTIDERVSGLSVLAYRVRIFRKLIQQRPDIMSKHTERWFKHTVKALLSTLKDINQSALDTLISAAKAFGDEPHVAKSVLSVMNRVKSDGETITHGIAKELRKLLNSDHAAIVPQIWSAVTALLPGYLSKNQFTALAEWLKVFEMFFKSTNEAVKIHANISLGFLVYAVKLNENTTTAWLEMLMKIPQSQLQSQRDQSKKPERGAATSAYFALLYHAFGFAASHKQLDRCWVHFVANFWTPLVRPLALASSASPKHAFAACRVVSALLDGSRKPCDPQRTLDLREQAMLLREDLPSLDPKWVRKSIQSILGFVETLLDVTPWTADDCKDEPAKTMWLSLLSSLNAASSQEVMASTDSKDAMAHLVNFLRRVWDGHTAQLALSQQNEDSWADKFCFLLEMVVEKLGAVQFSDKCLTRNEQDKFEAAATPSHRPRTLGPRTSPLLYFIDLLINQSEGKLSDSLRLRALKVLIRPCFDAQNTRVGRLELLRDCSTLVDASARTPLANSFWSEAAGLTIACLQEQPSDPKKNGTRQLGKEYEIVVEILSSGFPYLAKISSGEQLLRCFADTVRAEAGEGAVVLAVIEKVSESVLKRTESEIKVACLPFLSVLLRNLPSVIARRIIEQGRQILWPSSSTSRRTADFDPYNHLYTAIASIGSVGYNKLTMDDAPATSNFLAALALSIRQCPVSLLAVYLRRTQDTIRLWVEDPQKTLQQKMTWIKAIHTQVVRLWEEVCAAMHKLPRNNSQILVHLEPLITSGFVSRRRGIVELSIDAWNATFGKEETLRYPPRLEEALRRLRSTVELSLPSLEVRADDNDTAPSFYESDSDPDPSEPQKRTPRVTETPFKVVKSSRKTRSKSRSPMVPSTNTKKASTGRTPKARLRHENSQIQFEPIVSSPSNPSNQESQLLTERQREVYERQLRSSNVYAKMGSASPLPERVPHVRSPFEPRSDATNNDSLSTGLSRTPLTNVRALSPMDPFVGSSPTPQARKRSQGVASDRTKVATSPTTRTAELADNVEALGSSPPKFENEAPSRAPKTTGKDHIEDFNDSYDEDDHFGDDSMSFDDGTTIDEAAFLAGTPDEEPAKAEDETTMDIDGSDMVDLQLTAQLDAEIQAQKSVALQEPPPSSAHGTRAEEPNAGIGIEAEKTEVDLPTTTDNAKFDTETSSTSRVGDSFPAPSVEAESSQARNLRRSQRLSSEFSPQPASAKKRKSSTGRGPGRPKKNKSEDSVVTTTPRTEPASASKSKSASADRTVVIPDTTRAQGIRRSASLLSQVETQSEDAVVEDTPVPKRARRSIDKDVSEAKQNTPTKSRQLSHVQPTPKHSDAPLSRRRSSTVMQEKKAVQQKASEPAAEGPLVMGDQNAKVALQLPNATPAASQASQLRAGSSSVASPSRSFAERVILTPRSIINQLKHLKDALFGTPQLALSRQQEREADDLMFDIRRELHAAGQRGGEGGR